MKFACITVVKNAEAAIAEWIAFQLAIGFNTVFVLDNNSTDQTAAVARRFSRDHDVRVTSWPSTGPNYQADGFARAILACRGTHDWCACLDFDEFLVLPPGKTLEDLVDVPDNVSAIALNWAMFGSSGHERRPDGLVIENYLHRSEISFRDNELIKGLGRPTHIMNCRSPHFFDVNGLYIDMARRPIDYVDYRVERLPDYSMGKLHHYFVQSRQDWLVKMARGYNNMERKVTDFERCDRNEVFDDSALVHAPAVKAILANLPD